MVNNFKRQLSPIRKRAMAKPPPAYNLYKLIATKNLLYNSSTGGKVCDLNLANYTISSGLLLKDIPVI